MKANSKHINQPPLSTDSNGGLYYVIGDPQGEFELLDKMLGLIKNNPSKLPFADNDTIILMGNFIHPSHPNAGEFIKALREVKEKLKDRFVLIMGRNEHRFLKNREAFFKSDLGKRVIESYRTKNYRTNKNTVSDYTKNILVTKSLVEDRFWLAENLVKFYETNKFFICGSGVNPNLTLDDQYVNALMYTNKSTKRRYPKIIVHGTVSSKKLQVKSNRINVNSDCSKTGILSCAVLDDVRGTVKEIITAQKDKE